MEITVRLSAGLARQAGQPRLSLDLAEGATLADLLARLRAGYPALAPQLEATVAVIAGRHAGMDEPLTAGQEVALLVPISGGSYEPSGGKNGCQASGT